MSLAEIGAVSFNYHSVNSCKAFYLNVPGHFTDVKGQICLCYMYTGFLQESYVCGSDLNQLMKFCTITSADTLRRSSHQQLCDLESKLCGYVG